MFGLVQSPLLNFTVLSNWKEQVSSMVSIGVNNYQMVYAVTLHSKVASTLIFRRPRSYAASMEEGRGVAKGRERPRTSENQHRRL